MKSHTISSTMLSFRCRCSSFHYPVIVETIDSSSTENPGPCSAAGIGDFVLVNTSQLTKNLGVHPEGENNWHECINAAEEQIAWFLFLCKTFSEALLSACCCSCYKLVLLLCQKSSLVVPEAKGPLLIVPVALLVGRIRIKFCIGNLQYFTLCIYVSSSCRFFFLWVRLLDVSPGKLWLFLSHTPQDVHCRSMEHNLVLHLLKQPSFLPFAWPYAEMDWGSWSGWKITFFLVWVFFQMDLFSAMAYLMSVLTQWDKEGDVWWGGKEDDTGVILVVYVFTLIHCCLWGDSICCKHKGKKKKGVKVLSWLPFNLYFILSLVWIPSRSLKCR